MLTKRLIGIGVIVAAVAIVVLATVRPNPFKDTRTILARFDSAQGIGSIDRNVRVGGANAGEIGTVRRAGDDVIVELEIEPEIRVTSDARARLRPHTLFEGSAFVDLFPGSPGASELDEGELIPRAQTDVYVSLDEATRVFRSSNRKKLKHILHSGSEVLRGDAITGLRRTLRGAPGLFADLGPAARALQGPSGDELAGAVRGLSRTVAALGPREADLIPLAQRLNRTLAGLEVDGGAPLDAAIAALPGPLEELRRGGADLVAAIDLLDALAVELEPGAAALGPLLRDSRPLLRRATPIVERATPLVGDFATVLSRVAAVAPALRKAIKTLRPGVRVLAESVLPVLTADGQLGVPVYAQLAAAFTGATAALRPYQTEAQNGAGHGHAIRLGFYLDPEAFPVAPSCGLIADIDPQAAAQLEALGLCKP
jgi:phospholipid/cholesterol/gamma-HCH transport system substrate-binding protein